MTSISLPGQALTEAAAWVAELAPRRPTVPHLAGVMVTADEHGVAFAASDIDIAGRVLAARADVTEPGRFLVSGRLLADVARTVAKEHEVTLVTGDAGTVKVTAGKAASWALPLLDAAYYPATPQLVAPVASVRASAFAHAANRVLSASSDPTVQPMYGGVAIGSDEASGRLFLATTDRYRLAVAEIDWQPPLPEEEGALIAAGAMPEVIVPAPVLRHAVAAVREAGTDDGVVLHSDGTGFALTTPRHAVNGRIIGQPSAWRKLDIPGLVKGYGAIASVQIDWLRQTLDRAVVATDTDEPLVVRLGADGVEIAPMWGTKARAAATCLTLGYDGPEVEWGIKPSHLRDLLAAMESPAVQFSFATHRGATMAVAQPLTDSGVVDGFRWSQAPVKVSAVRPEAA